MTAAEPDPVRAEREALEQALARLVEQAARLAVARGLPYSAAEEMLKQAFVDAASAAHPGLLEHRKVSRIATATGINRREVTRLTRTPAAAREAASSASRSHASELFTHWRAHAPYCDARGTPLTLPRQGPRPSFESLAQEITRDVHARSLLDELVRLGIARWDSEADTVSLSALEHVPRGDRVRMLGFLGANVGDHLAAAVDNVLADDPRGAHFEQALFADGLSAASVARLRTLVGEQWRVLRGAVVPALESMMAEDARAAAAPGAPPLGRVRVGLYAFDQKPDAPAPADTGAEARKPRRRARLPDDSGRAKRPASDQHRE